MTNGFYTENVAVVDFSPLYRDFGEVWVEELQHSSGVANFEKACGLTLADGARQIWRRPSITLNSDCKRYTGLIHNIWIIR